MRLLSLVHFFCTTMERYKIVLLGSGGVGKSSILNQFLYRTMPDYYDPNVENSYKQSLQVDGQTCMLEHWDTAGPEEYFAMRDQVMREGSGFLLIYSITDRSSFEDIKIQHHDPILRAKEVSKCPMILVGNKSDLQQVRKVSPVEGEQLAKQLGMPFLETSALKLINIDEIFQQLVRIIRKFNGTTSVAPQEAKKKNCVLM